MLDLFNNILLSTGIWLVFLVCYIFLLKKETFFKLNRSFLLVTFIFGAVCPFLRHIDFNFFSSAVPAFVIPLEENIVYVGNAIQEAAENQGVLWQILLIGSFIYSLGVVFFSFKLGLGLRYLYKLRKKGEKGFYKKARIVWIEQDLAPFSFFNTIYLNTKYKENTLSNSQVLTHEYEHTHGRHSIDILLIEILGVVFWPSPAIQMYKKALRSVHEYLADARVVSDFKPRAYGRFLLNFQYERLETALVNSIISSQLKDRIIMMGRKQSSRSRLMRYAMSLPLFLLLFTMITFQSEAQADKVEVFKVVEEMPRFPGCEGIENNKEKQDCANKKLGKFIMDNLKYPKSAQKNGIEGMSIIQFIVTKDGEVVKPKVIRGFQNECDQAALDVVKAMPNFIPGKQRGKAVAVQYNLPIRFALTDDDPESPPSPPSPPAAPKPIEAAAPSAPPAPEAAPKAPVPPSPLSATEASVPSAPAPPVPEFKEIFKVVEEMPRFPGCESEGSKADKQKCSDSKMVMFLGENIKYPAQAKKNGTQGTVYVQMIIEKDGSMSDVEVVKSVGDGCDEESLRVVKSMPDFIPGKQGGKAVAVKYIIPIKYKLGK